jgi:hypothetical protein
MVRSPVERKHVSENKDPASQLKIVDDTRSSEYTPPAIWSAVSFQNEGW